MSRIGNQSIIIPASVTIDITGQDVSVKGPLGELKATLPKEIKLEHRQDQLLFTRPSDIPSVKALHGLSRSLINNLIIGVTEGFSKNLEMVGTGYRVAKSGDKLVLSVGYSHPVEINAVPGVSLDIEGNNKIIVKGIDKQLVGQIAANIRAVRSPEPYKGKGIRYTGETVRRKPGKAAKTAA